MRLLYIFVFLCIANLGIGQETFSDKEKSIFVEVYMDSKLTNTRAPQKAEVTQLLSDHEVSQERFADIFKKQLHGEEVDLSPNEMELIEEVKLKTKIINSQKMDREQTNCKTKGIDVARYESIKQKYKTDIQFQHSLKPFFSEYLKRQK